MLVSPLPKTPARHQAPRYPFSLLPKKRERSISQDEFPLCSPLKERRSNERTRLPAPPLTSDKSSPSQVPRDAAIETSRQSQQKDQQGPSTLQRPYMTSNQFQQLKEIMGNGPESDARCEAAAILVGISKSPEPIAEAKGGTKPRRGFTRAGQSPLGPDSLGGAASGSSLTSLGASSSSAAPSRVPLSKTVVQLRPPLQAMRRLPANTPVLKGYDGFYRRYRAPSLVGPPGSNIVKALYESDKDSAVRIAAQRCELKLAGTWNPPFSLWDLYTPRYVR